MRIERARLSLLIATSVVLAGAVGCWPTPSSVLEGTWRLVLDEASNSPVTEYYLTFDADGKLTEVSYTVADNATVTWDDPPASVSVNGDVVTIAATQGGNGLVFEGTLDSAQEPTSAEGTLTLNIVLGGVTVSLDRGQASLTRE